MKYLLHILLFSCVCLVANAQENFVEAIKQGDKAFKAGQYKTALNKYFSAEAFDPSQKKVVREKLNRVYDKIETLRVNALSSEKKANQENEKYEKLIKAFYFYKERFALAYKDGYFYFMDKAGNRVNKLGTWTEAGQFDSKGFAKVKRMGFKNTFYYLDTSGNKFRGIFDNEELLMLLNTPLSIPDSAYKEWLGLPCPPYCDFDLKDSTIIIQVLKIQGPSNKIDIKQLMSINLTRFSLLEQLELSNFEADSLYSNICTLQHLSHLNLQNNHLRYLPKEIHCLKKLKFLNLSNNKLTRIPDQFYDLTNLTELILNGNRIDTLQHDIKKLKKITVLDLRSNSLNALPPSMEELSDLAALNISSNQFKELPVSICRLKKLKTLGLYNNKLDSLPDEIGNLKQLNGLNIGRNKVKALPVQIGQLQELKLLNAFDNKLEFLPKEIGNLKKLEFLYLLNNRLTVIPPEIGNLHHLSLLDLRNNNLKALPIQIKQLKNLKSLILFGNQISKEEQKRIKELLPDCTITF